MKPAPFRLHRPASVEEAVTLLSDVAEEGGLILAGGQSLVPMMALRVVYPPDLVDINAIKGLDRVVADGGRLTIGATARHAFFHRPVTTNRLGELLAAVSRYIAHYPIRLRGTFCGSLAHADPASEWCLVAATLGCGIVLAGKGGRRRTLPARDYLRGAMTTAREADEMLIEAHCPLLPEGATFGFYEFNRRAGDFALGMCLTTFAVVDGVMTGVRVGLGGIENSPRRLAAVEALLEGRAPSAAVFRQAAAAADDGLDPMEDPATGADYRRGLAPVVIRRALQFASDKAAAKV
ncbi:MAG TPA: FAD binding domain-containing protein [Candidatus Binataceae bacterium]|nr:FAD binding domain-containing protein [Candidatus Binataceae bacterium]